MNKELLFGVYKLEDIESFIDGQKSDEKPNSGLLTFTRQQRLAVVNGSNKWVMAYTGTFDLNESALIIQVEACVVRELENTTLTREILVMDGQTLILGATGKDKSKQAKITWQKIASL